MASTAAYQMADRLLDGRLEEQLRQYRQAGVSFPAIARLMARDGVAVSHYTLRKWARELGIEDDDADAKAS